MRSRSTGAWLTAVLATLVLLATHAAPSNAAEAVDWSIDTTKVMVGGCMTLTMESRKTDLTNTHLVLDGEDLGPVTFLSVQITSESQTHLLLWYRTNPRKEANDPEGRRPMLPLFREPGIVELALVGSDVQKKSVSITVQPLADCASPSQDLLFPVLSAETKDPESVARWPFLLTRDRGDAATSAFRPEPMEFSDDELALISKHPDWSSVMPTFVARWRHDIAYARYRKAKARPDSTGKVTDELGVLRGLEQGIRDLPVKSSFARAVKDRLVEEIETRKKQ